MGILDSLENSGILGQLGAAVLPAVLGEVLGTGGQGQGGTLSSIVAKLEQAGFGDQVKSWIGNGQNLPVSGEQITQALSGTGALEEVSKLAANFGINEGDLANQLAEGLPEAVNHLTPQGAVPAA